jgi:DNA-3-methyladenine glycosylase II
MTISLQPRGPFSLPESLVLALTDDGGEPVAFRAAWSEVAGAVEVDFVSDLPAARVERHAARVLSLDVDASGLEEVGARDPVIGRLLAESGGRRPVLFGTPFEAAVWAVLSQRVSMAQAARVRDALAAELGTPMEVGGAAVTAFPGPAALAGLESFPGVWPTKLERVRALAAAAMAGDLEPERLRALDLDAALDHLQSLPGVGPFGATLILARGAGHPDVPPPTLRRFRQAVAAAYRLAEEPDAAKLAALSEGWRPYRAWVTYLLRSTGPG